MLEATASFIDLLGTETGQEVIKLLQCGTEAELRELMKKSQLHQDKLRETRAFIAEKREKLDQDEKEMTKALQDEESIFMKEATRRVMSGIRRAEDVLLEEAFRSQCVILRTH